MNNNISAATPDDLSDPAFWETIIQSAPEEVPLTEQEIAQAKEEGRIAALRRQQRQAIGPRTGWPEKYLEAVQIDPHGENWLSAFEVGKRIVDQKGILVLYGKRGNGKTRMAAEIACIVGRSQYRTAMRFFLEVRATFRKDAEESEIEVIDRLAKTELLILDEIQERGATPFEDRLLTHIIDARYANVLPTILIANLTKAELAASLGDSIVDRARENGKSIEFNWQSYRAKA